METYIGYLRVSTKEQGASGLGLEGQKRSIDEYVSQEGRKLIATYSDIESGSHNERRGLQEALKQCKLTRSTLIIAKLDRLSRNAAFLLNLRDSGVDFICCDQPHATRFTIGIYSLLAETERELICQRTREALKSAKERGVKLGGKREGAFGGSNALGIQAHKRQANNFAQEIFPVIKPLMDKGLSLNGVARELNAMNIKSATGKTWTASTVSRLVARVEAMQQ